MKNNQIQVIPTEIKEMKLRFFYLHNNPIKNINPELLNLEKNEISQKINNELTSKNIIIL